MAAEFRSGARGARGVLAVLIAGLCLLLAAAFVVGHLDASPLKPRIEAAFERATGHRLRIGGNLRLSLLPSPGFVADDVRVANLPGGTRPDMLVAREVSARLDLLGLLGGHLHVQSVLLDSADVLLETVDGEPNWRRVRSTAGKPALSSPVGSRAGFSLDEVDADGGRLAWHGLGRAGSGALALDHLRAQQDGRSSLTLFVAARHGNAFFTVSLACAPPAGFAGGPVPLRVKLTLGHDENGDRLDYDGTVTASGGLDGRMRAALPQLADFNALFAHAHLPAAANVTLDARISRSEAGRWSVLSVEAAGDNADLGRFAHGLSLGRFSASAGAPNAPLSVDAQGVFRQQSFRLKGLTGTPDLFVEAAGQGPIDAVLSSGSDTVSFRGALTRRTGSAAMTGLTSIDVADPAPLAHILQAAALPPVVARGELNLSIRRNAVQAAFDASRLSIGSAELPPTRVTALVNPGQLLVQASFAGAAPWLTWREDLASTPRRASVLLDGHDLPAASLSTLMTGRPVVSGRLSVRAALAGDVSGVTLDERTITGPIAATLLDADLDSAVVRDLLGHILHAARLPKLGGAEHLDCVQGTGAFSRGALALSHLSLTSPLLTMTGSGVVLLPGASLDLRVRPVLRLGAADIATEIALTGTFATPVASLAQSSGRYGLEIGRLPDAASCGGAPAVKHKTPKAADFLRAFGLLH